MAFIDCIKSRVDEELITEAEADKLMKKYDELVKRYEKTLGGPQAAAQAATDLVDKLADRLVQKKRNDIWDILALEEIRSDLTRRKAQANEFRLGWTGKKKRTNAELEAVAIRDFLEDIHLRHQNIVRRTYGIMDDFVKENRASLADAARGLANSPKQNDNMVLIARELMGEKTGNKHAAKLADMVRRALDYNHARYKAAGGVIGKLDHYFPQVHAKEKIKKVSFEEWRDFVIPRLDTSKMIDYQNGLPLEGNKLEALLEEMYETITTDGRNMLAKAEADGKSMVAAGRDVALKNSDSRFLHFADAEAQLSYNRQFGRGDEALFDMILGHIDRMARDTAAMEKMGPKPNTMMKRLDLRMAAAGVDVNSRNWTNGMYDVYIGRTDGIASDHWLLTGISKVHSGLRAAMLGSANISAISDGAFVGIASRMNGLPAVQAMGEYLKQLNPASGADRALARDLGYITENIAMNMAADLRWTGDSVGVQAFGAIGDFLDRSSNFVNRASGLAAMTKGARDATALTFSSTVARWSKENKAWNDLPIEFREQAQRFGIGEADWKIIKKTKLTAFGDEGVEFFQAKDIMKLDGVDIGKRIELSNKVDDWIENIRNLTTNEPTLRTRAITTGAAFLSDARKGTVGGTVARSALMFKSFPLSVMFNHLTTAIETSINKGRYEHLASILVGTTILGGFAIQLKEIVKGKTPKDVDAKFAFASILQGGGLGLFGDFIVGDYSRFGRTPMEELLNLGGPVTGLASDVMRAYKGNFDRAIADKDTNVTRDSLMLLKRYMPGGNLWYSRLVMERLIFDSLEEMADPKFRTRRRRLEQMAKDSGQKYWWRKGELSPR